MSEPEREFAALREEAAAAFTPPPMEWFTATAKRRRRRRVAMITAAAAVMMVGGTSVVAAQTSREGSGPHPSGTADVSVEPTPSGSASPTPTPPASPPTTPPASPSTTPPPESPRFDLRTVDWRQATLTLPAEAGNTHCPTGRVTLRNGQAITDTGRLIRVTHLADGDLAWDDRAEAVLLAHCEASPVDSGDGSGILLVVTVQGKNTLLGLGYAGAQGENHLEARVIDGLLVAKIEQRYNDNVVQERTYRWNGNKFVQVAGPKVFPTN